MKNPSVDWRRRAEICWAEAKALRAAGNIKHAEEFEEAASRADQIANGEGPITRPRDENGWRIPAEGTKARRIYDMTRDGKSLSEIAAALPGTRRQNIITCLRQLKLQAG